MSAAAEDLKQVLPDEIIRRATRIVMNQAGEKTVIQDRSEHDDLADAPDSVTISFTMPLETALKYFGTLNEIKRFSEKARL
ncbi:hypothetical protein [Paenibacillus sp. UNC496MF]|uniref:hypothetical protein n=1 Tax=Paenibacillus sp. UNC496MF TaxID=1502753 RepID=UPI000B872330|nr:hypothetical protein [Paenibacillus sp. UNC496MF]